VLGAPIIQPALRVASRGIRDLTSDSSGRTLNHDQRTVEQGQYRKPIIIIIITGNVGVVRFNPGVKWFTRNEVQKNSW